ncbi:hypothetical protein [Paenibacillus oryzisoli]|nr:hypothetical protein [Paenibacillus oryzisoli]
MYSAELSKRLTGSNESYPVHSADELHNVCQTILFKHKALLIKDPFGVSGKGNIKIDSISAVKRLVQYIQRQEQRGANTAFIVEPFFDVERDFSCQFHLEPDGSFRFISMQQMLNHHLAYLGSYSMAKEAVYELENRGYFKVMENIGSALYEQGYFGPVCVDSMQLTNGTLIPIVEINARKSMGLINHYLDGWLATDHRQGFLTFLSLGYRNHFDYEAMLQDMERAKLLFTPLQGEGIVPLSSATLLVNELYRDRDVSMGNEEEPFLKGRLYLSVFAKDVEVRMRLLSGTRALLASQGVSVYD